LKEREYYQRPEGGRREERSRERNNRIKGRDREDRVVSRL
jgi:hypothetical protein